MNRVNRGEQYTPKQFEKQAASPGEMILKAGKKIGKALWDAINAILNSVGTVKMKKVTLESSEGNEEDNNEIGNSRSGKKNKNDKTPNGGKSNQNIKKVDDKYLKKNHVDAHQLRKEYLGEKALIAQYDIYGQS